MHLDNAVNPPLDEALQHFGVKGMKWGVRKDDSGGGGSSETNQYGFKKKYTGREIRDARKRTRALVKEVGAKEDAAMDSAIRGDKISVQRKTMKDYEDSLAKYYTSEDAAIAGRMTRGEKAANLILGGPVGAVVIGINKRANRKDEQAVRINQQNLAKAQKADARAAANAVARKKAS